MFKTARGNKKCVPETGWIFLTHMDLPYNPEIHTTTYYELKGLNLIHERSIMGLKIYYVECKEAEANQNIPSDSSYSRR